MYPNIYLTLILLFGTCLGVVANQQPINVRAINYDVRNGLIDNKVLDGELDPNGGLWLVTARGLSYFDGHKFINFTSVDPLHRISSDDIKDILIIGEYVYVAADSTIDVIHVGSKMVETLPYVHKNRYISKLIGGAENRLLVLDELGMLTDTQTLDDTHIGFASVEYSYVHVDNAIIVTGNNANKTAKIDLSSLQVSHLWSHESSSFRNTRGLVKSKKHGVMNLLSTGTVILDPVTGREAPLFDREANITNYLELSSGHVIYGSKFNSLMLGNGSNAPETLILPGYEDIFFKKIITDNSRTVFILHDRGVTVFRVPPSFISKLPTSSLSFSEPNILYKSIIEKPDKRILLLMYKNILEYEPENNIIKKLPSNALFNVSGVIKGNRLFVSTDGTGLVEYDLVDLLDDRLFPTGNGGPTEHSYYLFDDGDHLIAGFTNPFGLWSFDLNQNTLQRLDVQSFGWGPNQNAINHIAKDGNGHYWVSTNRGLYEFDTNWNLSNHFTDFGVRGVTPSQSNKVNQVLVASDGRYWVATRGGLYVRHENGAHFESVAEVAGNDIASMEEDAFGRLWLATFHGLVAYDTKQKKTLRYYQEDGFVDNEYNIGSHLKASDSTLYFGGLNGVIRIEPDKLSPEVLDPKLYLGSIVVEDNSEIRLVDYDISGLEPINLVGISDLLTISVSFNEYVNPAYSKYLYRFEGLDQDWLSFDNGLLRLRNLPIGLYHIEIIGIHASGATVDEPIRILVHVTEPFVGSVYFVILVILLVVAIIIGFLYYRYSQKIELRDIKTNLLNDIHDELGGILTKASMRTELISSKSTPTKDDLMHLQRLHKEGMQSLRNLLWNISSENATTQEFQDRMTDWLRLIFEGTGIDFIFENRVPDATFNLSVKQRRQLLPIIKEIAVNSMKHSNGTQFHLVLDMLGVKYSITAFDNGKNDDNVLTESGFGIKGVRSRIAALGGEVSFEKSVQGFKTVITF